jgi:hypothetical protein
LPLRTRRRSATGRCRCTARSTDTKPAATAAGRPRIPCDSSLFGIPKRRGRRRQRRADSGGRDDLMAGMRRLCRHRPLYGQGHSDGLHRALPPTRCASTPATSVPPPTAVLPTNPIPFASGGRWICRREDTGSIRSNLGSKRHAAGKPDPVAGGLPGEHGGRSGAVP